MDHHQEIAQFKEQLEKELKPIVDAIEEFKIALRDYETLVEFEGVPEGIRKNGHDIAMFALKHLQNEIKTWH